MIKLKILLLSQIATIFILNIVQAQHINTSTTSTSGDIYHLGGKLAIGTSTPNVNATLEVVGPYSSNKFDSQLHLRTTNNATGMFLGSHNAYYGVISQGAHYYSGGDFKAVSTYGTSIVQYAGKIHFNADASLTTGSTFDPSERMTITSSGSVGIGTTSPSQRLHIFNGSSSGSAHSFSELVVEDDDHGMISILTPSDKIGYFGFADTDDDYLGGVQYDHSTNELAIRVNNRSADILLNDDGYVGIGSTTPDFPLDVERTGNETTISGITFNNVAGFRNDVGGGILVSVDGNKNPIINSTYTGSDLIFGTRTSATNYERMRILDTGNVGIGTTTPSSKLEVDGTITSREVKVEASNPPDHVFAPEYQLLSLQETEEYIKANSHLPEIPSAKEMEANGVELGEMNMLLLKKIEELTLHMIDLKKENEKQNKIISYQNQQLLKLLKGEN